MQGDNEVFVQGGEQAPVVPMIREYEARVDVTWSGQRGTLPDPVAFDTTDQNLKVMLTEAIRAGSVPGLRADQAVNLTDFVVDRFPPSDARPWNLLDVRPKTAFGR